MEATLASLAVGYSITIEVTGPSINSLASTIPKACNSINVCTIKCNCHIQVELLSLQNMNIYGNKAPSAMFAASLLSLRRKLTSNYVHFCMDDPTYASDHHIFVPDIFVSNILWLHTITMFKTAT